MITITQPQIDAICWAAERHVRSLKRSGSDHEREIKEIQGCIEALKGRWPCELSFIRLANLLKMYPIKQLEINVKLGGDNTKIQTLIQLVSQQTKTLHRIVLNVENAQFTNDFRGLDKLVNWLSVFERIEHFTFDFYFVSTKVLEMITSLQINSLFLQTEVDPSTICSFIRTNKSIEYLEIVSPYKGLPSETLKALKENQTLKVSHFSHSEAL